MRLVEKGIASGFVASLLIQRLSLIPNGIWCNLQDVCDQFQIPQKLYGRDKEVAMLLAAFVRVACPGQVASRN
ncbi:hypothetical protein [Nostoc sp.]|uniref:hypothetical protein n=1 Tax=Nostoc sp. TaxID=1180 RepID=UPI002FFC1914